MYIAELCRYLVFKLPICIIIYIICVIFSNKICPRYKSLINSITLCLLLIYICGNIGYFYSLVEFGMGVIRGITLGIVIFIAIQLIKINKSLIKYLDIKNK